MKKRIKSIIAASLFRGEREGELSVLEHHVLCRARERLVEEGRRIGLGLLLLLLLQRLLLGLLLFGFDRTGIHRRSDVMANTKQKRRFCFVGSICFLSGGH